MCTQISKHDVAAVAHVDTVRDTDTDTQIQIHLQIELQIRHYHCQMRARAWPQFVYSCEAAIFELRQLRHDLRKF